MIKDNPLRKFKDGRMPLIPEAYEKIVMDAFRKMSMNTWPHRPMRDVTPHEPKWATFDEWMRRYPS